MKLHLAGFKYASVSFKYPPIKIHQYLHRHSFPKAHQDFTTFKYFPTSVYDILFLALHSKFIVVATFQIFLKCFSTEISATLSIFKIFLYAQSLQAVIGCAFEVDMETLQLRSARQATHYGLSHGRHRHRKAKRPPKSLQRLKRTQDTLLRPPPGSGMGRETRMRDPGIGHLESQ